MYVGIREIKCVLVKKQTEQLSIQAQMTTRKLKKIPEAFFKRECCVIPFLFAGIKFIDRYISNCLNDDGTYVYTYM